MGFSVFHVASGAIHLVLLFAVVGMIARFLRGRTSRTPGPLYR